jgi:hypothetical protein
MIRYFTGNKDDLMLATKKVVERQRDNGKRLPHFTLQVEGEKCSVWTEDPDAQQVLRDVIREERYHVHEGDAPKHGRPLS